MGSVLSVKFLQKHDVVLFLDAPYERMNECRKDMLILNDDDNFFVKGRIKSITEDLETAVKYAEWIFITYPPFYSLLFPRD